MLVATSGRFNEKVHDARPQMPLASFCRQKLRHQQDSVARDIIADDASIRFTVLCALLGFYPVAQAGVRTPPRTQGF